MASGILAVLLLRTAIVAVPNLLADYPLGRQPAKEIVEAMLLNASTAMLETDERSFGDSLGSFVSAGRTEAVGAELKRGLSATLRSGAIGRMEAVTEVEVEDIINRDDDAGFSLLTSWNAIASGGIGVTCTAVAFAIAPFWTWRKRTERGVCMASPSLVRPQVHERISRHGLSGSDRSRLRAVLRRGCTSAFQSQYECAHHSCRTPK